MAGYVISSGVPYGSYLRKPTSSDDVGRDLTTLHAVTSQRVIATIKDSSAELVASHEALRAQNIELLKETKAGFTQLAWDVQQITAAVKGLDATFTWGFNSVLTHTGRMADTLESLLATAKAPSKTRAYEYFDDGRKAFDRGYLPEALEQVNKAISGDHTSTGYKLEWRFYLLRGAIQVGTFSHPQLLDLPAAEASYLAAAKYARAEDSNGAALAMLGAGWACYCQGRLDDALTHTDAATSLVPALAEGHFQASKILMALGRSTEGLSRLEIAVGLDPAYVVKAAADGDFQTFTTEFESWCAAEGEKSSGALKALYDKWSSTVAFWRASRASNVDLSLLASTISAPSPPLLDTLICFHALDPLTRNLRGGDKYTAQEMSAAIEIIPAPLKLPEGLLQSLRDLTGHWPVDSEYFALGEALAKRGQAPVVAELCQRAHERGAKPLELFALWLSATPARERTPVMNRLTKYLQQVPASGRGPVLGDFQVLSDLKAYPQETIDAIRTRLIKRYEQWSPEIDADLTQRANAFTKHPLEGIVSHTVWSMLGMAMAVAPIYAALKSLRLTAAAWSLGVMFAIVNPVLHRFRERRRRFRALRSAESRVLRHLTGSSKPR